MENQNVIFGLITTKNEESDKNKQSSKNLIFKGGISVQIGLLNAF
jgi:hypothetical protein